MIRLLRATTTFVGLITTFLLLSAFFTTFRSLITGREDNALAMIIPFLVFAATLVALNSGLFAAILSLAGLALFGLALAEDGFSTLKALALIGLLVTLSLCVALARLDADQN